MPHLLSHVSLLAVAVAARETFGCLVHDISVLRKNMQSFSSEPCVFL